YDPLILDGDVQGIPVGMQWRTRLGPAIYIIFGQLMFKVRIDSNRPLLSCGVRGPFTPRMGNAIIFCHREYSRSEATRSEILPRSDRDSTLRLGAPFYNGFFCRQARCGSLSDAPQNVRLLLLFSQQPTHKGNA